jgi:hypothetical protein
MYPPRAWKLGNTVIIGLLNLNVVRWTVENVQRKYYTIVVRYYNSIGLLHINYVNPTKSNVTRSPDCLFKRR